MKSNYSRVIGAHQVIFITLFVFCVSFDVIASGPALKDARRASLIEELTSHNSDDLIVVASAAGTPSIDLKERFQHVMLAQMVNDDLAMSACVDNKEQADVFFGRDLRTGKALLPAAAKAHNEMIEAARLHGMSPQEYQFLGLLIDQAQPGTNKTGHPPLTNFRVVGVVTRLSAAFLLVSL